jgi:hypothetical protein
MNCDVLLFYLPKILDVSVRYVASSLILILCTNLPQFCFQLFEYLVTLVLILIIDRFWRNKKCAVVESICEISNMKSSSESVLTLLKTRNEKGPRIFAGDATYSAAQ